MAPESTSAPAQQPAPSYTPAPTSVGAPSWATVVRKGKWRTPTAQKHAMAAKPPSPANAPAPTKVITMRERRLVIKCDGSPLTPTAMELQDTINGALSSSYIQTISSQEATLPSLPWKQSRQPHSTARPLPSSTLSLVQLLSPWIYRPHNSWSTASPLLTP
ncbi:hypothetical protein L873DRAFT_1795507 [Choiromyces venosus 120613-1]|uniref:Uncharacterized protein n=1 Tax=Choiromyces venosus 120613-1 TaxID=1336337 RepID=A0A3N4IW05_9PEZI|nr:hypothetical protein L873DRAFT_1795507 [Choiromyces venosus 120613-1]